MTVNQVEEDFTGLHERVLTFMGAFSSVQFAIDSVVGTYLRRQMPVLGEELEKQFLRRIRDDQRLPLFKKFAAEMNYTFDIPIFVQVYNRAKQIRDMVGHSHGVTGPVYSGGISVVVVATTVKNTDLVPTPLLPSTFDRLKADCEWMQQHVFRAAYEGKAADFLTFAGEPYEPPIPAAAPVGGEPL